MKSALQGNGFERPIDIASEINGNSASSHAWLAIAGASKSSSNTEQRNVELVRFAVAPKRVCATHEALARLGWQVNEHTMPFDDLPQKAAVLVLDDLWSPTLTTIGKDQWQALQTLVARECRILWVTTGSQFQVTNPDNSMVHGLARTLRAEDPSLVFKTLDVESADSLKTPEAIDEALKQLYRPQAKTHIESELVERGGITYIGRVTVDEPLNHVQKEDVEGGELQLRSLHDSPTCIRLGCERLGMIDSLQWGEVSPEELPLLGDDFVEVEVFAAGLNFKVCAYFGHPLAYLTDNCLQGYRRDNGHCTGKSVFTRPRRCWYCQTSRQKRHSVLARPAGTCPQKGLLCEQSASYYRWRSCLA